MDQIAWITNERARSYVETLPRQTGRNLQEVFPQASPDCLDLLKKMLDFNPHK